MYLFHQLFSVKQFLIIKGYGIITALSITIFFFLILLVLGVRKSYKLKQENDRLNSLSTSIELDDENKKYKDFTEGHLYENR
ncbi:hypothetical protein GCM10022271_24210 [Corallibacter vietnamensis]|uniref:Uncharacterized protein n=1 Tax=Corallibacter vietnamensis TaxID=904130 RepID=A0ABP7HG43_9FLAO